MIFIAYMGNGWVIGSKGEVYRDYRHYLEGKPMTPNELRLDLWRERWSSAIALAIYLVALAALVVALWGR